MRAERKKWMPAALIATAALSLLPALAGSAERPLSRPSVEVLQRVSSGDVSGAVQALRQGVHLDHREGLLALRRFSLAVLANGLKDGDAYERCFAASALGERGDWSGESVLAEGVASSEAGVRRAAIEGLGTIGHGKALRMLEGVYRQSNGFGRVLVLEGLRDSPPPQALDLMIRSLRDEEASVRLQAVEDLGRLGDPRAAPDVRRLFRRDGSRPFERVVAAHALLRLGDRSGMPFLLDAVEHRESMVRSSAVLALGYAGDDGVVPRLSHLLQDRDPDVRIAAAASLTRYQRTEGLAELRRALHSNDPITRRHAAALLEHLDYGVGRPVILRALAADDIDLRLVAAHVVGVVGDTRSIGVLLEGLRASEDPIGRAAIAWALGRMRDRKVLEPLLELVQERESAVRYTAADALTRAVDGMLGAIEQRGDT